MAFIRHHSWMLNFKKSFTSRKELMRRGVKELMIRGVTRFATKYFTLRSIQDSKKAPTAMFEANKWRVS